MSMTNETKPTNPGCMQCVNYCQKKLLPGEVVTRPKCSPPNLPEVFSPIKGLVKQSMECRQANRQGYCEHFEQKEQQPSSVKKTLGESTSIVSYFFITFVIGFLIGFLLACFY